MAQAKRWVAVAKTRVAIAKEWVAIACPFLSVYKAVENVDQFMMMFLAVGCLRPLLYRGYRTVSLRGQ